MVDKDFNSGKADSQEELLRRYCAMAEESLGQAIDLASARRLADELCERFGRECSSPLVVNATRKYLEQAIERKWRGKDGR